MALVPFLPPPGLNRDDTAFAAEGQWDICDGVRFYRGIPETIGSHQACASAPFTKPTKMLAYRVSGAARVAVATPSALYTATLLGVATDITPAAGWTTNTPSRFNLAMWGDNLLACPSNGTIYESVAGAQATVIANAPDKIVSMLVTPTRQVMALGCNEEASGTFNSRCIRWSDIEDNTDWTSTSSNNAGEYVLPGQDDIVGACVSNDYIVVWTVGAMYLGQFIGDPAETFRFTRIASVGMIGLDAWTTLDGVIYFMGHNYRIYAYQVGALPVQVECPVQSMLVSLASGANDGKTFAHTVSRLGEVWFWAGASSSTHSSRYFVYHVAESAAAQRPVWTTGTTNNVSGTLGMGCVIDSPALASELSTVGSTVLCIPYSTSATSLTYADVPLSGGSWVGPAFAYITSASMYMDNSQRRVMIRGVVHDFELIEQDITLQIGAKDRPRSTESGVSVTLTSATTKKDFRKSGKIFSLSLSSTSNRWRMGKFLFDMAPMGER